MFPNYRLRYMLLVDRRSCLWFHCILICIDCSFNEGWWSSNTVDHGLWTATVNNQKEKIFIGLDIGYRGLETVRGFNIISVLVLFSGLCTSIISFIPKFASSSQAGIWIHAVSAIFISKLLFIRQDL